MGQRENGKVAASRLVVGTSGWSYPDWKDDFYPGDVAQRHFLEYYARHFPATELNASYYRLPSSNMVRSWRDRTPPGFRFCVKLSRLLTHRKRLKDPDEAITTFTDRMDPLRERLGPVLAQLPPSLTFHPERVEHFLQRWRALTDLRLAVEARHRSWFGNIAREIFSNYDVALVQADSGGHYVSTRAVTADFVYLRYHGPGELYASGYSPQKLSADARRIAGWLAEGRRVWAFFNNTEGGLAWRNAERLWQFAASRLQAA